MKKDLTGFCLGMTKELQDRDYLEAVDLFCSLKHPSHGLKYYLYAND